MKKLIYIGPSGSVRLADGTLAVRGEAVEIEDNDFAASLLKQSDAFEPATVAKKKKSTTKIEKD